MNNESTIGVLDQFQTDLIAAWKRLPNIGFFLALLVAWLALFSVLGNSTFGYVDTPSLLVWMLNAYTHTGPTSDDGHGLFIPFVVLALFWWRRNDLLAVRLSTWWPGLVLVALALALHIAGYVTQQARVSVVALFAGIYGLMGVAWGPQFMRASFFPYFLLGFCVPLGSLAEPVTFPLRLLVCHLVEWISHYILAIDVIRQGTELRDPTNQYQYDVAVACSGMRSLIATIAMGCVFAFLFSLNKWWKRIVLIVSTVPLAVAGNLLRMMAIVIASEIGGQEWGNKVHDGGPMGIYSLLPYVPGFVGLLFIGDWLERSERNKKRDEESPSAGEPREVVA